MPLERRKELATGVICSRLGYALETVSTGRMKDLEALQAMKVKAARWVLGARRLGWSTTKNFKKLGWLTIQQEVTYKSVRMALKVLQTRQPRFLFEKITTPRLVMKTGEWHEIRERRMITMEEFSRMKLTTRKSWAVRSTRWMAQIPKNLLNSCVKKNSSKKELKKWCSENIPTTGDRILRGRSLEEGRTETGEVKDRDGDSTGGGYGPERRLQRAMQKWLQGHAQLQARQGEQEQMLQQNVGEKEETTSSPTGEDQLLARQPDLKWETPKVSGEQKIKEQEKESKCRQNQSQTGEQDKRRTVTGLASLPRNRKNEERTRKKITTVLLSLVLLFRGTETVQIRREHEVKHKSRKKKMLQESCRDKTEKTRCKTLKRGIG